MWEMPKPITEARTLADLFSSIEPYRTPKRGESCGVHPHDGRALTVGRYCTTRDVTETYLSLRVTATPATLDAIERSMIKVDHDQIFFEIVMVDGGETIRVFAKYGQILGARLLAELPSSEAQPIRKLAREAD